MTDHPISVPDACTLPTAQRPLRLAEFDALFATAARGRERLDRTHLRLVLAGGSTVESTVRDLTARESDCCAFFTFTTTVPGPGQVRLDIEVPDAYADVLDALAARFDAARAGRGTW